MLRVRLRELAKAKGPGWSLKVIAEIFDVEYQTVNYWNTGRCHPKLPTLLKLSQLFNCSIDDLLEHR